MKALLDTHVFLWYISDDKRLKAIHREIIEDVKHEIFLSVASVWEAAVKQMLMKIQFPEFAGEYLPKERVRHRIKSLSIDESCLKHLGELPNIHHDPFDRILICQALENIL